MSVFLMDRSEWDGGGEGGENISRTSGHFD